VPCPVRHLGGTILRADSEPARLVVAQESLLPVAALLARDFRASGASPLGHGGEIYDSRQRLKRNLERTGYASFKG
jgi:hypothetical protein